MKARVLVGAPRALHGRNNRCTDCGRRGHNARTCDDPDVLEQRAARDLHVTPVQ